MNDFENLAAAVADVLVDRYCANEVAASLVFTQGVQLGGGKDEGGICGREELRQQLQMHARDNYKEDSTDAEIDKISIALSTFSL
jgi:hypothetical protein